MGRFPLVTLHLLAISAVLPTAASATLPDVCTKPCSTISDCIDERGILGTYKKTDDDPFPSWENSVQCGTVDCMDGFCKLEAWKEVEDPCGFVGDCTVDSDCASGPTGLTFEALCVPPFSQCEYRWCPLDPNAPPNVDGAGFDAPRLDEKDDRFIGNVARYYTPKIYVKRDYHMHQPAFYTEYTGCIDVRVLVSDAILTSQEVEGGALADRWKTICRGKVVGKGLTERTYMLPEHCDTYYADAYTSHFLYIGVEELSETCPTLSMSPSWASECDCFMRWNGTKVVDSDPIAPRSYVDDYEENDQAKEAKGSKESKGAKEAKWSKESIYGGSSSDDFAISGQGSGGGSGGSGGGVNTCAKQKNCLKFDIFRDTDNPKCDGGCDFTICMTTTFGDACGKGTSETISHTCKRAQDSCLDDDSCIFRGESTELWDIGDNHQQCQTVPPNGMAYFLVKDAKSCTPDDGTHPEADVSVLGLDGVTAQCAPSSVSYDYSCRNGAQVDTCTGNGLGVECVWSVRAPDWSGGDDSSSDS